MQPHHKPPAPAASSHTLNPDMHRRDRLLQLENTEYEGGLERFSDLDAARLRKLIDEGFLDPASRQGESPSVWDFLAFMERWPCVLAHGYAVDVIEQDYRVSIEGIECDLVPLDAPKREQVREEFAWMCGDADEYFDESDYLYAWWD